jgi:hypothetical protein
MVIHRPVTSASYFSDVVGGRKMKPDDIAHVDSEG